MFIWARKEISRYIVCFIKTLSKISHSILAFSLFIRVILLFSLVLPPLQVVQAFSFSSIFADPVYAQSNQQNSVLFSDTSATMILPRASISAATIFADKNTKDSKNKGSAIDLDATVNIVSENALLPATGPLGVSDGKDDPSLLDTSVYVVRKGDSMSAIAEMFGVSVNTILAANDMKKGDKLSEGDVLFILPISGLEHEVTKGQTLKGIAALYKVEVSDIVQYNDITEDTKLAIGDVLMIPGADMIEGGDKPAPNLASAPARDKNYYDAHPLKNIIGYFINPLPTGHKTQGLHGPGHRGIDIGAPTGTSFYASAPGVVIKVVTGCKVGAKRCGGGYGNMVMIQHPNGTKTLYGHMTKVNTHNGATVERGAVIGFVGSTGLSTGPHVHFEVFDAKNPGADWSWANN